MAKKRFFEYYYSVDFYKDGLCYRSTTGVPKGDLKYLRQRAKLLGEIIKVELEEKVEL